MSDLRFVRWQGLAIAQLSVAVALISGLSVTGLGVGFSLLLNREITLQAQIKPFFIAALVLLLMSTFLICGAVIARVMDFRLTARKIRKNSSCSYDKNLTIFLADAAEYGRATWRLFWGGCVAFALGMSLLAASIGNVFADRLL